MKKKMWTLIHLQELQGFAWLFFFFSLVADTSVSCVCVLQNFLGVGSSGLHPT